MNGLVLAGGRSSRMGAEKGDLMHPDGRTMLQRSVDLLRAAGCGKIVVSLREGQQTQSDISEIEIVRDAGAGPLDGMIAGMESDSNEDWLIVACDLPRLTVEVLEGLLGFPDPFVVYERDGMFEPLCGFYAAGALEVLSKSRDAGQWGLQKILRSNGARALPMEDVRVLENANTPEDWARGTQE